jgi:hypothetical protein
MTKVFLNKRISRQQKFHWLLGLQVMCKSDTSIGIKFKKTHIFKINKRVLTVWENRLVLLI